MKERKKEGLDKYGIVLSEGEVDLGVRPSSHTEWSLEETKDIISGNSGLNTHPKPELAERLIGVRFVEYVLNGLYLSRVIGMLEEKK